MRVLFIHSGADLYGASRSLLRLASGLVLDGNPVLAVLPSDGPLKTALGQAGVEVLIHPNLPIVTRERVRAKGGMVALLLDLLKSVRSLAGVAREFRPDIIHTNTSLILSPGIVARFMGIPHLWHVREFFEEFPRLWRWYQWYMAFLSTRILCVSKAVADQFKSRIRGWKVEVLHNGFPVEEFTPVEQPRVEAFRRKFHLDGFVLVGVVGRVKFGRKGQDVVLRAAHLLKDKFPEVRFVFIGSPFPGNEDHLEMLVNLADELGVRDRIVYTGDVEDIKAAYAALDISVLPSSLPEPFGGVVIESMAMGKPVVGTNIGGTIEQIEHEVTGLLVEPSNPERLKEALERLLSDRAKLIEMGKQGKARFLKLFDFKSFYLKVEKIYSELALHERR